MADSPTSRHGGQVASQKATAAAASADPYSVRLTPTAKAGYARLYQKAVTATAKDDPSKLNLRLVEDAISRLIPASPDDKRYALTVPFAGVYRMKRGQTMICWMIQHSLRNVLVMYLEDAPTSAASIHERTRILATLVNAGLYKQDIEEWRQLTEPSGDASVQ